MHPQPYIKHDQRPSIYNSIKNVAQSVFIIFFLQMSGKLVSWTHVEELFATDSSTVGGLQACSRLTPVHIHPTNMQKMNVSLAAQVNIIIPRTSIL